MAASRTHLRTAALVLLLDECDHVFDHVGLALRDSGHVYGHQIGCSAVRCGGMYQIGYVGAGDFVLGVDRQSMFGRDPPIHWRSTTAVRPPERYGG